MPPKKPKNKKVSAGKATANPPGKELAKKGAKAPSRSRGRHRR
jgi:hypothetical protein